MTDRLYGAKCHICTHLKHDRGEKVIDGQKCGSCSFCAVDEFHRLITEHAPDLMFTAEVRMAKHALHRSEKPALVEWIVNEANGTHPPLTPEQHAKFTAAAERGLAARRADRPTGDLDIDDLEEVLRQYEFTSWEANLLAGPVRAVMAAYREQGKLIARLRRFADEACDRAADYEAGYEACTADAAAFFRRKGMPDTERSISTGEHVGAAGGDR